MQGKFMKTNVIIGMVILGFLMLWSEVTAFAQGENPQDGAGFSVEAVKSEAQYDHTKSFFYLKVVPGQPETIEVKVKSTSKDPVRVGATVHDGTTAENGQINYTETDPKKIDESLKEPITSFVTIEGDQKEFTLQPNEEKTLKYQITPPQNQFTGVKLGSLRFVGLDKEETKQKEGAAFTNEYAYVLALMLTEEDEVYYNDGADLVYKKAGLDLVRGEKMISVNFQNPEPKVMQGLRMTGKITKKDSKKVLCELEEKSMSTAPNSNFDFNIPWGASRVKAGTYTAHMKAWADEKEWEWTEDFVIGEKEAKKVNDEATYVAVAPDWAKIAAGVLGILTLGLIIYLAMRQFKWKKEAEVTTVSFDDKKK